MADSFFTGLNQLLWKPQWSPKSKPEGDESVSVFSLGRYQQIESPFQFGIELDYYQRRIKAIRPATFDFFDDEAKKAMVNELTDAIQLFRYHHDVEQNYGRLRTLAEINDQISLCENYIKQLQGLPLPEVHADYPVEMAMAIGRSIHKQLTEINQSKFQMIHAILDPLNVCRLDWVWGGSLLQDVLSRLSGQVLNIDQAELETTAPAYSLGVLSFTLYYTTFFTDLFMLLKHTIPGPWMSDKEKERAWKERLAEQWHERKFRMANDGVWATVNLLCFFWLKGDGKKGHAGDMLTVFLLLADMLVSIWLYMEEEEQYKRKIQQLEAEITVLKRKKGYLTQDVEDAKKDQLKLEMLEEMMAEAEQDWHYNRMLLINNCVCAAGYAVACSFFLVSAVPGASASLIAATSLTANVACFVLAVAYSVFSTGLEVGKARAVRRNVQSKLKDLEDKFDNINIWYDDDNEADVLEKKLLYLQIMELQAKDELQIQQIRYTALELTRTLIVDTTLPMMVFALSVFVPLTAVMSSATAGFAIIGFAFFISMYSKYLLKRIASPGEAEPSHSAEAKGVSNYVEAAYHLLMVSALLSFVPLNIILSPVLAGLVTVGILAAISLAYFIYNSLTQEACSPKESKQNAFDEVAYQEYIEHRGEQSKNPGNENSGMMRSVSTFFASYCKAQPDENEEGDSLLLEH